MKKQRTSRRGQTHYTTEVYDDRMRMRNSYKFVAVLRNVAFLAFGKSKNKREPSFWTRRSPLVQRLSSLLRVRARVVLRLCRMCVYVLTPATSDCAEPERAEMFHRSDENRQSRKRRNIETFEVYGRTVATDVGISAHRLSQK